MAHDALDSLSTVLKDGQRIIADAMDLIVKLTEERDEALERVAYLEQQFVDESPPAKRHKAAIVDAEQLHDEEEQKSLPCRKAERGQAARPSDREVACATFAECMSSFTRAATDGRLLDDNQKDKVMDALRDGKSWLVNNPDADAETIKKKRREVEDICVSVYNTHWDHCIPDDAVNDIRSDGDDECICLRQHAAL